MGKWDKEIESAHDRNEFVQKELMPHFDKLSVNLGVVDKGSAAHLEVVQKSDWPIDFFTTTCGCLNDIGVMNEGSKIAGNITIEANAGEETVYTDGERYYIRSQRAQNIYFTDLGTGKTSALKKDVYKRFKPIKLKKYEHSISLFFHTPTSMYVITKKRLMKKNANKPGVHIPVTAYVLPENK